MSKITPQAALARVKLARKDSPIAIFKDNEIGYVNAVFANTLTSTHLAYGCFNSVKCRQVLEKWEININESGGEFVGTYHRDDNLKSVKKVIYAAAGKEIYRTKARGF